MIDFGAVGDELLVHIDMDSFTDLAEASRASTWSSYSVFASPLPLTAYVYHRTVYPRYRTHLGLSRYLDT